MKRIGTLALLLALGFRPALAQQTANFTVELDQPRGQVSSKLWGVFFEDINMGADGGLYAELVKNRSFEFPDPWMGWKHLEKAPEGTFLLVNTKERKGNPRAVHIHNPEGLRLGLQNEGFRGMGIKKGESYVFSLLYKQATAGLKLRIELLDEADQVIGQALLPLEEAAAWQNGEISLTAKATAAKGKLNVWIEGAGDAMVDMLSLFPTDTWKGRSKGLRKDMVQMLADMKPGFVRFPGGCIVEGKDLATRFQWKKTVGPIEERELLINRWNTEFKQRPTPDYFQTFGLGFYEYFQLAEDIGAEALPILNCGMACQFNTAEVAAMEDLDPYIQDALDLIEFANGDTSTSWGKLRATMGHPEPFGLKMLGVGNENWGPQYIERLKAFQQRLKAKHPEIAIIASSGTGPDGERFDYLNERLRAMQIDVIDEHYYRPPAWFLDNASRYDDYDRQGAKVFAGEYASHMSDARGPERSTWEAALSEAAFMTGLERNSDVVEMASYAPLFGHVDAWQWSPDLIWVDNLQVYGTPSYQVQKLYATNMGTAIIPILRDGEVVAGKDSLYASSVYDATKKELIIKFINYNAEPVQAHFDLAGKRKFAQKATKIVLANPDLRAANSMAEPLKIKPQEEQVNYARKRVSETFSPYSFTVIRLAME